ncbi:MAG TPA: hypothetical protein VIY90_12345 [Steroidobacteraceae bacterium]
MSRPGPARPPRAARGLHRAAGLLAGCVLADSGIEHYRGSFHNPGMVLPLASAALSLIGSVHGGADRRAQRHRAREAAYALAVLTGLAGTAFHLYNIGKRSGGFSWLNLFYAAPLGAPAALSLSGLLGLAAERLRAPATPEAPRLLGLPAGRALAALTSVGLLGTAGEAGLLHLRGAYHNPAMYLPVSMPPIAAALLAYSALAPAAPRRMTRWWLRLTALLGFAGAGFHAYGVSRNMGGWRNWTQNLLNGPPLPAPPSFTALALAGLAALSLLREASRE